jgi:predicted ATPase
MSQNQRPSVPLREWTLRNFKSVEDASVSFAPLTLLVGSNSSGKSSLLQSILLISQAAAGDVELSMTLNGPLVELGDFQDVLFAGIRSSPAVRGDQKSIEISGVFDFSGGRSPAARPALWQTPALRVGTVHWGAAFSAGRPGDQLGAAYPIRSGLKVVTEETGVIFSFESKGAKRTEAGPRLSAEIALPVLAVNGKLKESGRPSRVSGVTQVAGIPTQFYVERDLLTWLVEETIERNSGFFHSVNSPAGSEPESKASDLDLDRLVESLGRQAVGDFIRMTRIESPVLEALASEGRGVRRDLASQVLARDRRDLGKRVLEWCQRVVGHAVQQADVLERRTLVPLLEPRRLSARGRTERVGAALVQFMARNILYLGPLREDPHVLYAAAPGDRPGNVGKKGERTIAILHQFGSQPIECPQANGSSRNCSLAEGVSYWLREFGIAEKLETALRPRLGLEPHLDLADVARKLDLTSVGVGVSQVLPVLVMGLHAPRGAVLLMEQPELHLHPALQHRLGDFLLACARNGKQLIVETHSDHLVTRLRRRIAESESDDLLPYIKLIFAERSKGRTAYNPVEITPFGTLQTWPKGFFDQSASESKEIVRAGVEKRKRINEESGET